MKIIRPVFGKRGIDSSFNPQMLVLAREAKGLTRWQLARKLRKLGFDTKILRAMETGWRVPTVKEQQILAKELGVLIGHFHRNGKKEKPAFGHFSYDDMIDGFLEEIGVDE